MTIVDWQFRRAGRPELDDIMAIESTTFGTDAWSRTAMKSELASANTFYLVASDPLDETATVGYAGLLCPGGASQADIQTIAVAASARRRGLGRALMTALIAEARERGARELFLEVRADNPGAIDLYLSLDFEEIAVRKKYYQPDGVDARIMRLTIAAPRISPAVGA